MMLVVLQHIIYQKLLTLVFFTTLSLMSSQLFSLISSIHGIRWYRVVLDGRLLQEYPVNAPASRGSILGPTFFPVHLNDLSDDFIRNIAIYANDTTLYSKCDLASAFW